MLIQVLLALMGAPNLSKRPMNLFASCAGTLHFIAILSFSIITDIDTEDKRHFETSLLSVQKELVQAILRDPHWDERTRKLMEVMKRTYGTVWHDRLEQILAVQTSEGTTLADMKSQALQSPARIRSALWVGRCSSYHYAPPF